MKASTGGVAVGPSTVPVALETRRPRNVDAKRAAALLYGDWGTSKAYVIGLALAAAGYGAFWLLLPMSLLTALVGINYIAICRLYPDGGGVYASVRHRSRVIAFVGAFLLIADYLVTAALSALSAFDYLGVSHPEGWAAIAILFVGILNYFGPKHSGGLAFFVSLPVVCAVVILGLVSIPHIPAAIAHLRPPPGGPLDTWKAFVSTILALSGVEAVANATQVMPLDDPSPGARPCVSRTATPAILAVMTEVCFFTAFLGLAAHALENLRFVGGNVDAPGHPGVRDYMLRYMGEIFVGNILGPQIGQMFGWFVSLTYGVLLLSAVNTAVVGLVSIQYVMSHDGEMPRFMQKLNRFGVPVIPLVIATLVPAILVATVRDMAALADLYAVGVVGAIATNLGATATDVKAELKRWERGLMLFTFLVMGVIELTVLVDKPHARVFAVTLLAIGLALRGLAQEWRDRRALEEKPAKEAFVPAFSPEESGGDFSGPPILCAVRDTGKTLDFAIKEAQATKRPLYVLFVRLQKVVTERDRRRVWQEDPDAKRIFGYALSRLPKGWVTPCYVVSESVPEAIVQAAAQLGASRVILGFPREAFVIEFLRGNFVREVARRLPENVELVIVS
ncbi:amino acid permease [Candidatus Methylacidithermus pantelleriae]|uniref:Universal stress protein UspA n=1 Tax=Candidatus Methylacidithermus pantelleriae TaxID=2744239 RepID=A0A8J2BPZ0_9BACT|nr:amino acid permease [Candidatus Methylacidithermus pantelleriae]CAF0702406.1 Universal stress protein UspA [Candidatus Methylacidithermus pantelleriae]